MIHREGIKILLLAFCILLAINGLIIILLGFSLPAYLVLSSTVLILIFILRFFRVPDRKGLFTTGTVYAPADGKVMVVEETEEKEYFKDNRIQISIFMSVWNVHINWYPAGGLLPYYKYHPGKYLVARHPKSSVLNERNTVVIRTETGTEILVRQIAGTVARRIVSYSKPGSRVRAGDEMGFIRFGSRVDVFLPPGSTVLVKPGQSVRGLATILAELK